MIEIENVFSSIPADLPRELFQDILVADRFKIERIVSRGHASPEGFWYDQDENEWVILLKGRAGLRFEGRDGVCELTPGDYVHIPAHVKHRVEWTDPETETVWMAVMYRDVSDMNAAKSETLTLDGNTVEIRASGESAVLHIRCPSLECVPGQRVRIAGRENLRKLRDAIAGVLVKG